MLNLNTRQSELPKSTNAYLAQEDRKHLQYFW